MERSPSKSRVKKAGKRLRDWWSDPSGNDLRDSPELMREILILLAWRDSFREPLDQVIANLKSMAEQNGLDPGSDPSPIVGRLKREPQIVEKLARLPTIPLSEMQDIGGCRLILPDGQTQVDLITELLKRSDDFEIVRIRDHVTRPKVDGYRAVHVVVRQQDRLIEIQLRTPAQHGFAEHVEGLDLKLNTRIKIGKASEEALEYVRFLAEISEMHERNLPIDKEILTQLQEAYNELEESALRGERLRKALTRQLEK